MFSWITATSDARFLHPKNKDTKAPNIKKRINLYIHLNIALVEPDSIGNYNTPPAALQGHNFARQKMAGFIKEELVQKGLYALFKVNAIPVMIFFSQSCFYCADNKVCRLYVRFTNGLPS